MKMFNELSNNINNLIQSIKSVNVNYPLHSNALLSLPCEHHFSTMRSRYQMPTLLQYCEQLNDVMNESLKRLTVSSYHYYTNKHSYYPKPELKGIDVYISSRPNQPSKRSRLSASDSALMRNWRVDFCAGIKFHSTRFYIKLAICLLDTSPKFRKISALASRMQMTATVKAFIPQPIGI